MDSRTPKVESKTPENQCCAATVEEMCAATLGHYDDISTKARHWSNQVPQAIKFWYLEKPKLELALAAAEKRIETIQKDNCSLSDIGEALERRAEAAEARAREKDKDAERYRWLKANHLQTGQDSWIRTGDDLEEAIDAALAEKDDHDQE